MSRLRVGHSASLCFACVSFVCSLLTLSLFFGFVYTISEHERNFPLLSIFEDIRAEMFVSKLAEKVLFDIA